MKLFTNKWVYVGLLCAALAACSSSSQEPVPQVEETVTVEETVLPPTAQAVATPQEPAEKQPPKTPKKTTLYPNEAVLNLKAWDKKLKFLKTAFTQTTTYDGVPVSSSQGMLYYDKDKNLLRLDTDDGDGKFDQSAVTDKQKILILDGQGREITTLDWTEWQKGQPNQALFDFGNYTALLARHNASLQEPNILVLTPKEGENYTLYITLSQQDYFPTSIKIVADLLETEAKLSDTQKNTALAFNTFRAGGLFQ